MQNKNITLVFVTPEVAQIAYKTLHEDADFLANFTAEMDEMDEESIKVEAIHATPTTQIALNLFDVSEGLTAVIF